MRGRRWLLAVAAVLSLPTTDAPAQVTDSPPGQYLALPPWTDAAGFSDPSRYGTIQLGDINGDGRAELVGRGHTGVKAWQFDTTTGQWTPLPGVVPLTDTNGWGDPAYWSTARLVDLRKNGQAALMYRGAGGMSFASFDAATGWGPSFGTAGNGFPFMTDQDDGGHWLQPSSYETIHAADLDGDGLRDLFGRDSAGLRGYFFGGAKWAQEGDTLLLTDQVGFDQADRWRTIQAADVDLDGTDEVLARWPEGVSVYTYRGGHWSGVAGPALSDAAGWSQPAAYSSLQTADLDGDRRPELFGLLPGTGVVAYERLIADGSWYPYGEPLPLTDPGWAQPQFYETLQTADLVPGRPGAEVMIRGSEGLSIYSWFPNGGWAREAGPPLSDELGFDAPELYGTIHAADVDGRPGAEIVARSRAGMHTWRRDPATGTWVSTSATFPDYAGPARDFSTPLGKAYKAIPAVIGARYCRPAEQPGPDGCVNDLRADYYKAQDDVTLLRASSKLGDAPAPAGVDPAAWDVVRKQVSLELGAASAVATHAKNMTAFYNAAFVQNSRALTRVGGDISLDLDSSEQVRALVLELVENAVEGVALMGELASEETGQAVGAGLQASESLGLGPDIQTQLSDLQNALGDDLLKANAGATAVKDAAMADWGLLSSWSDQVENGPFRLVQATDAFDTALARTQLEYEIFLYQTLSPEIWRLGQSRTPSKYSWGPGYTKVLKNVFPVGPVADGVLDRLFQPTEAACLTTFTSDCTLGVPVSDVFLGLNGWRVASHLSSSFRLSVSPERHRNRDVQDLHLATLRAGRPAHIFIGPYGTARRRIRSAQLRLDGKPLGSARRRAPFDVVGTAPARQGVPRLRAPARTSARTGAAAPRPAHPRSGHPEAQRPHRARHGALPGTRPSLSPAARQRPARPTRRAQPERGGPTEEGLHLLRPPPLREERARGALPTRRAHRPPRSQGSVRPRRRHPAVGAAAARRAARSGTAPARRRTAVARGPRPDLQAGVVRGDQVIVIGVRSTIRRPPWRLLSVRV